MSTYTFFKRNSKQMIILWYTCRYKLTIRRKLEKVCESVSKNTLKLAKIKQKWEFELHESLNLGNYLETFIPANVVSVFVFVYLFFIHI